MRQCHLPLQDFDTHMYVVGKTKKGKSKFLEHVAYQLIVQGQGCGLLDPHSDLADDLLSYLAPYLEDEAARARVIYFQPGRDDVLVPFNVLASPDEPYTVAQHVLEAFRRTWPESLAVAPRFDNIVLAALLVLVDNRLTLAEMPRLLTEPDYREELLQKTTNPEAVRFFHERYDRWGRDQAIMAESVLNKVGAFVINPRLRLMLGQGENRLPFREIMDGRKVLICDLGRVDGETRRLLGSLIVTGLEQAAFARKDLPRGQRHPFFFLIDEFQDYCANEGSVQTLSRILSECRKFGLHLGLAHQTLSQLGGGRMQGALENAQIKVIFGTGRQTAQALVEELFVPQVEEVKHEVEDADQRERTHPAFYSLSEQWERFTQRAQRLPRRRTLVQLPERDGVLALRTPTVPEAAVNREELEILKTELAKASGLPWEQMEAAVSQRQGQGGDHTLSYYEPVAGPLGPAEETSCQRGG
ncbi:MAG: type IV secretion system DNA-binding domain-containing protein [Anaerolineaceae bacterium]|nr:type IV secretion system DNA-binding domain-containing protein [Anaerolineaceae bacterium]